MTTRHLLLLILLALFMRSVSYAQDGISCEEAYGMAVGLYADDRLFESLRQLDSLTSVCQDDHGQMARVLFLKAVIEARNDSVKPMRRTMERLFRNDRRYVLSPYDPLILKLPQRELVFDTYESLIGARSRGPGLLRKDHGQWRAGIHVSAQRAALDLGAARSVFADDELPAYEGGYGWEAGANMEWDVVPNLAVRASIAWSELDYSAQSPTVRYREQLSIVPVSLGVKKMFWAGAFVPYLLVEGTYASMVSADAEIARSGDGLRYLVPRSLDRSTVRADGHFAVSGAVGVGLKFGSTVLFVEGRYRHALDDIDRFEEVYTETELLTNYYWMDRKTTVHVFALTIGVQYVLKYHAQNRIHQ